MENRIEHPTDAHLVKVWGIIERMTSGKRIVISEQTKYPELWITCAKMWMDCYGYSTIEFTPDYKVLKRLTSI